MYSAIYSLMVYGSEMVHSYTQEDDLSSYNRAKCDFIPLPMVSTTLYGEMVCI